MIGLVVRQRLRCNDWFGAVDMMCMYDWVDILNDHQDSYIRLSCSSASIWCPWFVLHITLASHDKNHLENLHISFAWQFFGILSNFDIRARQSVLCHRSLSRLVTSFLPGVCNFESPRFTLLVLLFQPVWVSFSGCVTYVLLLLLPVFVPSLCQSVRKSHHLASIRHRSTPEPTDAEDGGVQTGWKTYTGTPPACLHTSCRVYRCAECRHAN